MLTKRQKQVLDFYNKFSKKYRYPPSLEKIAKHFRLRAVSGIHQHIQALKDKGYLSKQKNQPRSIKIEKSEKLVKIPLLGTIAAGQPIEVIQQNGTIMVQQSLLAKSGKHYALKVVGDSMIDEGIFDGDTVIIREQPTVENGETAVALINDNEATLKKVYKEKNRIKLQPANPNFKPIFVKDINIQGKVTGIVRQFKKPEDLSTEFHALTIKYLEEVDIGHRKSLGQYFTPKSIREALLSKLPRTLTKPKVLDPACGTGEFLLTAREYFPDAELYGWDIDKKLINVAKVITPTAHLSIKNSLLDGEYEKFDFVIGNPPYFEFQPDVEIKEKFKSIINGRPNIFGFFIHQGLQWLKAGGYLSFVVPPSMNNGAYFARLRSFIIHNANVEYIKILKDSKIFRGALQSTMLLVLRKGENNGNYIFKKNGIVIFSENAKDLQKNFRNAVTLKDLGYVAKTGRVVWNQNKDILTNNPEEGVPLIWAHNIDEKKLALRLPISNPKKPQYIKRRDYDIGPAIVVNRITGSVSSTKLRAAIVPVGMKFFAENHVNVIFPPKYNSEIQNLSLKRIAEQIASPGKSDVMKNITGNTQISKTELENLFPLKASS